MLRALRNLLIEAILRCLDYLRHWVMSRDRDFTIRITEDQEWANYAVCNSCTSINTRGVRDGDNWFCVYCGNKVRIQMLKQVMYWPGGRFEYYQDKHGGIYANKRRR